ncbi:MAG: hypothetical protein WB870_03240 [Gallionellaceae bacterium]
MQPAIQSSIRAQMLAMRLICLMGLLLSGCSTSNQLHSTTQVLDINLTRHALQASGIAFITPTSVTGQEEDKQALALAFTDALQLARPDLRVMPLPQTLGAINGAGLANEYRQMFEDYGVSGIFSRDSLQKVSRVIGIRYLAQLKLSGFRQEAKNRWNALGVRILETKTTSLRLYLQIWDGEDGSVAWEGSEEITSAYESVKENPISFKTAVEQAANTLVARLP